jgi:hypothetical protein
MTIAYGVPESAIRVVDTGAARTFTDYLRIKGVKHESTNAALARRVVLWERGLRVQGRGSSGVERAVTHSQLEERWDASPIEFATAATRGRDITTRKLGTSSAAGHAFFLFAQIDSDQAHSFFEFVLTGANLPDRHPALTLRERLVRERFSPDEQVVMWIRAWNAFRDDRTLATVYGLQVPGKTVVTDATYPMPK